MCKDGPDSHRHFLDYHTLGAPKDKHYLWVRPEPDVMAVNILDLDDPEMIPDEAIDIGLNFIREMQEKHRILLCHCNSGHTRGPTTAFMYLRAVGEMPDSFLMAEKKYRVLYPKYDPGIGMRAHARTRWKDLPNFKFEKAPS